MADYTHNTHHDPEKGEATPPLPKEYFRFRFAARNPRDQWLSQMVAQDMESGDINVSEVIKALLAMYYEDRLSGEGGGFRGYIQQGSAPLNEPGPGPEGFEERSDPLVAALAQADFMNGYKRA